MLFSFLTFNFYDSPRAADHDPTKGGVKQVWPMAQTSDSAATSPMSGGGTPKPCSVHTPPPMKTPEECPEVRPFGPADGGAKRRRSIRRAGPNGRRSSVFFKLPDLASDIVVSRQTGLDGNNECTAQQQPSTATAQNVSSNADKKMAATTGQQRPQQQQQHHGLLASKLSRPSSRRRRASVAPVGGSMLRTRVERKDISVVVKSVPEENQITIGAAAAEAAAAAAAAGEEPPSSSLRAVEEDGGAWRNMPRGELLLSWGDKGPTLAPAIHPSPRDSPARSSPRALSAGHRRESCRDGGGRINRVPKGLTAERLLEDAQDVARIRSVARLRATHQGVCWMASNWRVGDKKGLLSGKRYLVLCDNTVWAELRKVDASAAAAGVGAAGGGMGSAAGDQDVPGNKQGGFLPIMSMVGAIVQHCEVATSNNGWVIEVVNTAANVTLWLDPENPTSLLRWGSVLCQALATKNVDEHDATEDGDTGIEGVE